MPSAAKGAVLIMPEKKTSGIKNFFEEFKAFAMRGNVLDMQLVWSSARLSPRSSTLW